MFAHNLKIAFRSLRKYKTQNIISIVGLAVGFVCFAFSALWIRYEMSYDGFHANADRIYRVNIALFKWNTDASSVSNELHPGTPYPLANWLKANFQEVEDAGANVRSAVGGVSDNFSFLFIDYSFSNIFNLNLPEDFLLRDVQINQ